MIPKSDDCIQLPENPLINASRGERDRLPGERADHAQHRAGENLDLEADRLLDFAQQGTMVFWLFLIGEISFLVAIYVLGADWWGKFRRIFVWEAPES